MKYKKDYYQILGVKPNATQEEIKQAYRRLAILNHPDKNPTSQTAAQMQEINEAYGVLGDEHKRMKYDFECGNSITSTQTPSTSNSANKTTTENLERFFPEKEKFGREFIATVGIAGCIFILFVIVPFSPPEFVYIFIGISLSLIPITLSLLFWKSFKSKEKEKQCPKCGEPQAAEKMGEKLMGVFRKSLESLNKTESPQGNFFTYEKYNIHYKCKYCSYEWLIIKTKRL